MKKLRLLVNLSISGKFYAEGVEIDEKDGRLIIDKCKEGVHFIYINVLSNIKEAGYDEFVQKKVNVSLSHLENQGSKGKNIDVVHASIMEKKEVELKKDKEVK